MKDVKKEKIRVLFENDEVGFEHAYVNYNDNWLLEQDHIMNHPGNRTPLKKRSNYEFRVKEF